jgi:cytochrome c6
MRFLHWRKSGKKAGRCGYTAGYNFESYVSVIPTRIGENMNRMILRGVQVVFLSLLCAMFLVSTARAQGDAAKNYTAKCATCHGPNGDGSTPAGKALKARDFHSADVQNESDATLAQIIANGKNKMPAYGKQLKEAEIKDLIAYCRALGKK